MAAATRRGVSQDIPRQAMNFEHDDHHAILKFRRPLPGRVELGVSMEQVEAPLKNRGNYVSKATGKALTEVS